MISPKKIKTIGDRCLRQKSEEVEFDKDEMAKLYAEMCQAMWTADGIGLAAPQIGINKRVIVVDETTEEHGRYAHLMVNPKITWKSEETVLPVEVSAIDSFPSVTDPAQRTLTIVARIDLSLRGILDGDDGMCEILNRCTEICNRLLAKAPSWYNDEFLGPDMNS